MSLETDLRRELESKRYDIYQRAKTRVEKIVRSSGPIDTFDKRVSFKWGRGLYQRFFLQRLWMKDGKVMIRVNTGASQPLSEVRHAQGMLDVLGAIELNIKLSDL